MTKIIGFAGKKQSGKNTMANIWIATVLQKYLNVDNVSIDQDVGCLRVDGQKVPDPNKLAPALCKVYALADPLKRFCCDFLGLNEENLFGSDENKNKETSIKWADMPGVITNRQQYNLLTKNNNKHGLYYHSNNYMTNREVAQYFGTEVVRRINDSAWINGCINSIKKDNPRYAFISDIRFTNEILAIKNIGTIVGLTKSVSKDKHESEQVKLHNCHYIINNKHCTNVQDLLNEIYNTFKGKDLLTI